MNPTPEILGIEKQLPTHLPSKFLASVMRDASLVDIVDRPRVDQWVTFQADLGMGEIGLLLDLSRPSSVGLPQDDRIRLRNAIALDVVNPASLDYVHGLPGFLQLLGNITMSDSVSNEAARQIAHFLYQDKSGTPKPHNADATFIGHMKDTVGVEAKGSAASLLAQYLRLEHPTNASKATRDEVIGNALAAIAGERADAWVRGDVGDFPPQEQWIRHQFMQQLTAVPADRDVDDLFVEKVPDPKAVYKELLDVAQSVPKRVQSRRAILESRPLHSSSTSSGT